MTKKRRQLIRGLVLCVLLFSTAAGQPALAAPVQSGEIVLIINGDDVGITPVFTAAMPAEWKNHLPVAGYIGIYSIPGQNETLENRTAAYRNMFRGLSPGVYYVFTHQGILPEGRRPDGDLDLRINEYKLWSGKEKTAMLAGMGITVKPFSALKDVFK